MATSKQTDKINKAASILGRRSAEARIRKWGKKEFVKKLQEWGKKGGRPKGSGKKQKVAQAAKQRKAGKQ